jgi:hypothetical protein
MNCKRKFLIIIVCVGLSGFVFAQTVVFPTPAGNPNQLFYLQRTPNTNTIVYELNFVNGKLDAENPIHVFWLRYQDKGQKEELSYIQRKFAYGIKYRKVKDNQYELTFVSYKKYKMYLQLAADGKYRVYTNINNKMSVLNKIYLEIHGGAFWTPNIEYVEISGKDPASNEAVKEKIKI